MHFLKNLEHLYQLTANHLRGVHVCFWADGSVEKNGKGIHLPTTRAQCVYTILEDYVLCSLRWQISNQWDYECYKLV